MTEKTGWTFLTNHTHVLITLARTPDVTLREVSMKVGITERAVQHIVDDLEKGGYLIKKKEGRVNHYRLVLTKKLRHPVESDTSLHELIALVK